MTYDAHSTSVVLRGCIIVLAGWGGIRSAARARRRSRRRFHSVPDSRRSSSRRRCDARACALRRSQHESCLAWSKHRFGRLEYNKIGDAGAQSLAAALPSCSALTTLGYSRRQRRDAWSVRPITLTAQLSPCVVAILSRQAGGQQHRRCGRGGARGGAPVVFGAHRALVSDGAAMLEACAL